MASILFASESLMDPRIQVKLDKYQKCGNIISQTSLLSSYTGSETDADSDSHTSLLSSYTGSETDADSDHKHHCFRATQDQKLMQIQTTNIIAFELHRIRN